MLSRAGGLSLSQPWSGLLSSGLISFRILAASSEISISREFGEIPVNEVLVPAEA